MEARQFERAVETLEAYHAEFGSQADVEHLLGVAREEAAQTQRRSAAERCLNEAKALLQEERFEDAVRYMDWASEGFDHEFVIEGDEVVLANASRKGAAAVAA